MKINREKRKRKGEVKAEKIAQKRSRESPTRWKEKNRQEREKRNIEVMLRSLINIAIGEHRHHL